ncbi:hypothetical protein AVEN_173918-1 [Araneus ventricosus]|uniref:Uncharacterized protein n=1 Tax=Araneus ventricosus TaxID=182803 RepID=A0A4Y2P0R9_ARAVE|nr:hypothetical protein AVEN_173918-1 [Araneus ventricosus]
MICPHSFGYPCYVSTISFGISLVVSPHSSMIPLLVTLPHIPSRYLLAAYISFRISFGMCTFLRTIFGTLAATHLRISLHHCPHSFEYLYMARAQYYLQISKHVPTFPRTIFLHVLHSFEHLTCTQNPSNIFDAILQFALIYESFGSNIPSNVFWALATHFSSKYLGIAASILRDIFGMLQHSLTIVLGSQSFFRNPCCPLNIHPASLH